MLPLARSGRHSPASSREALGHGRPARLLGGHDEQRVVAGDGAEHAGQPGPVERRADDVGRARRGAQDDEVAGVRDLDHPVAEHPAEVVLGRPLVVGQLGDGVDGLAAADPHLDGAEVLEVARDRRLRGGDALAGEQLDQLGLAGHRVLLEQLADAVLALRLARALGAPRSSPARPVREP